MKKEDLFDALGDVNNQYIKEAHMKNKRKNNIPWVNKAHNTIIIHIILDSIIP